MDLCPLDLDQRAMIEALIAGERDPARLADLTKGRLRALHGRFGEHHAMLLRLHLDHISLV
jgi:transposase